LKESSREKKNLNVLARSFEYASISEGLAVQGKREVAGVGSGMIPGNWGKGRSGWLARPL
jgi:hypothetical protein